MPVEFKHGVIHFNPTKNDTPGEYDYSFTHYYGGSADTDRLNEEVLHFTFYVEKEITETTDPADIFQQA